MDSVSGTRPQRCNERQSTLGFCVNIIGHRRDEQRKNSVCEGLAHCKSKGPLSVVVQVLHYETDKFHRKLTNFNLRRIGSVVNEHIVYFHNVLDVTHLALEDLQDKVKAYQWF